MISNKPVQPLSQISTEFEKLGGEELNALADFPKSMAYTSIKRFFENHKEKLKDASMNFFPLTELDRFLHGNRQGQRDAIEMFLKLPSYAAQELERRKLIKPTDEK